MSTISAHHFSIFLRFSSASASSVLSRHIRPTRKKCPVQSSRQRTTDLAWINLGIIMVNERSRNIMKGGGERECATKLPISDPSIFPCYFSFHTSLDFSFFLTLQASFIGLFTFLRSTDNPPTILYPTLDSTKRHYNFTLANGTTKIPQSGPCHRLLKGWNRACTVRPS